MQRTFKAYVERPHAVHPAVAGDVLDRNGAKIYKPDFFEVPTDLLAGPLLDALCGMLIYLLGYGGRALLILRKDPRRGNRQHLSRRISAAFRRTVRIITAWVPPLQGLEAARWCGSSPAGAARIPLLRRRSPGASRPSGSAASVSKCRCAKASRLRAAARRREHRTPRRPVTALRACRRPPG